jgi:branched-chain amino acid transport system permease protein
VRRQLFGVAAAIVLIALLPFVLSDVRVMELATVSAYFIAILGLDLLVGQSGRLSLGQGAFMAVGAYTTAILVADHGVRDVATIPIAGVTAGGIGLLGSVATERLRGSYLPLATLGFAIVLPTLPPRFGGFSGGAGGISFFASVHQTGRGAGALGLSNADWLYALAWTIGVVLFLLTWGVLESRHGRSLRAVRDSDVAAVASGLRRRAYPAGAFAVAAAFAGVAGSLLAIDTASVDPGSFPVRLSLALVVGAVAGGFGSIWGAVGGALLVEFLDEVVGRAPQVPSLHTGATTFAFGVILVVLVVARPLLRWGGTVVRRRGVPRTDDGSVSR